MHKRMVNKSKDDKHEGLFASLLINPKKKKKTYTDNVELRQ